MRTSSRTRFLSFASLAHIVSGAVRLCACVAFSIGVTGSIREAQGQLRAFEWVDIKIGDYISGASLLDVNGMNNKGDIIGNATIGGVTTGWVYRMSEDKFYTLPMASGQTGRVRAIDDNGNVVGWTSNGANNVHTGKVWEFTGTAYQEKSGFSMNNAQIWGVTASGGYIAGYYVDSSSQATTAFVRKLSTPSFIVNLSVPGGSGTAAALDVADDGTGWAATGYVIPSGSSKRAAAWSGGPSETLGAILGDSSGAYPWSGRKISGLSKDILGWKQDGSNYKYHIWYWNGSGWDTAADLNRSNPDSNLVDFNERDEFVQSKAYHYYTGTTLNQRNMDASPAWINVPSNINSSSWRYYGLDNRGIMAGKAATTDNPAVQKIILAVPRNDDNNNDSNGVSVPDFRDIYASTSNLDTNGDWLLDKVYKSRPGMHAPGPLNSGTQATVGSIDKVYAVRNLVNQGELAAVVDCSNYNGFRNYVNQWGANQSGYALQKAEIVYTLRTVYSADDKYDAIPSTQTAKDTIRANIRTLLRKYAPNVDYFQLGNEIFGGPGEYYFTGKTGWFASGSDGKISDVLPAHYAEACQEVMTWIFQEAEEARIGSCLGGRPVRLVYPAITYGSAVSAVMNDGTKYGDLAVAANRAAYSIDCVTRNANTMNAIADFHFHFAKLGESKTVADDLVTPETISGTAGPQWEDPVMVGALEWGPRPSSVEEGSGNWWFALDGQGDANEMVDNDTGTSPEGNDPAETWDDFLSINWLIADTVADLPSDALSQSATNLKNNGFRLLLYGPPVQYGNLDVCDIFDMAAFFPTKRDESAYGTEDTTGSIWQSKYETAANAFVSDLSGWDPHTTTVPETCQ